MSVWFSRSRAAACRVAKRRTMTFPAALRRDRIEAPWLIDGPINGERFLVYVEKVLVPTLKPGDVIIMDDPGPHKGKAVRRAIRAVGAKLVFPPKYSPDPNQIERLFSRLKHWPRKARGPRLRCSARCYRHNSTDSRPKGVRKPLPERRIPTNLNSSRPRSARRRRPWR